MVGVYPGLKPDLLIKPGILSEKITLTGTFLTWIQMKSSC